MKIIDKTMSLFTALFAKKENNEISTEIIDIANMPIIEDAVSGGPLSNPVPPIGNDNDPKTSTVSDDAGDVVSDIETVELSPNSLLDNQPYMSLAEQCCQMHDELDRMSEQITDPTLLDFISMQKSRIRESLMLSGASIIDEETEFNLLRHKSTTPGIVTNGTTIKEIVEPGVLIEDRAMIKAKVGVSV